MTPTREHGSLGGNIKAHYAGAEGGIETDISLRAANCKYRLYSCYSYIKGKKPKMIMSEKDPIKISMENYNHTIQDSGLFTMMFGAKAGTKFNMQDMIQWQDKLMEFVLLNGLDVTCVEMDVQKVLGVKEAWMLRERMKQKLPRRQINVFHFEDGKDGLDRIIDFSEYIAISVPELRKIKPKTYREDTIRLANYIKNRKPEIDIHLLGGGEGKILERCKFCTSVDATSWMGPIRWGSWKRTFENVNPKVMEKAKASVLNINESKGLSQKSLERAIIGTASAMYRRALYEKSGGNQD